MSYAARSATLSAIMRSTHRLSGNPSSAEICSRSAFSFGVTQNTTPTLLPGRGRYVGLFRGLVHSRSASTVSIVWRAVAESTANHSPLRRAPANARWHSASAFRASPRSTGAVINILSRLGLPVWISTKRLSTSFAVPTFTGSPVSPLPIKYRNPCIQCFRSCASSASRIAFSIQLVTVRASSVAARLIRSVMPAGSRNPRRSGRWLSEICGSTARFFLLDTVGLLYVQRTHAVCQTANPVQRNEQ